MKKGVGRKKREKLFYGLWSFIVILFILLIWYLSIRPSNEGNWTPDQRIWAYASFEGENVTIYNVRNFTYESTGDYRIEYYNKTYDLSKLDSMWYVVEPFSGYGSGAAHTFLSFGFGDEYVAISIEIRKQEGQEFSAYKGLLKYFTLMYVIGDENDVLKLRTNYRKDEVYLYRVNTTEENMRLVFLDMLNRTNKLRDSPEFYNVITNTCTTNIVRHVNHIVPGRVPLSYKVLMPAYSDQLAYDLGLIVTNRSFNETREHYRINNVAMKYGEDPKFSVKIREGL